MKYMYLLKSKLNYSPHMNMKVRLSIVMEMGGKRRVGGMIRGKGKYIYPCLHKEKDREDESCWFVSSQRCSPLSL